ncbi:HK97 family phage prohead protease [Tomitella gaofuii]|uniref:HK97 family phage prohead protease n=1 Tax=Tomitella gaofuii TaxID=2760083 RepID=UPI0015FCF27C|nr:HK97 family phage prohead protease [Tomitella gaofuii]
MEAKTKSSVGRIEVKADGEEAGVFSAYASVFGVRDSYGDVVEKGAFTDTLKEWSAKGATIPLLFAHKNNDPDYFIGSVSEAVEDETGLRVRCKLDLDSPKGEQVYRLIKDGRLAEMSFMYNVRDGEDVVPVKDGKRDWENRYYSIKSVGLYEVSVVHIGANPATSISDVKAAGAERDAVVPVEDEGAAQRVKSVEAFVASFDLGGY